MLFPVSLFLMRIITFPENIRKPVRVSCSSRGLRNMTTFMPTFESETEERKESWDDDCLKALAALANTRGGTLWVGVRDNGHPVLGGWRGDGKEQERISNQIVSTLHIHPASMTRAYLKNI
jgi:predicted HTH transcriptional regulator